VDSDKNQSSFDLRPCQYVQLLRSNCEFPAHLTISDSKRWPKNKPIFPIGSSISVGAFLHQVKCTAAKNPIFPFNIDVTHIADRTHFQDGKDNDRSNPSTSARSRTRFNYQAQKKGEKRKAAEHPSDNIPESSSSKKKGMSKRRKTTMKISKN
jgi:hypothetical protein